ncbi:hypothetical protein HK102_002670 [Quaeritorhiza haematococci]|nr:hypothetical protein HK102_002670 [Quaeritorhiza haematococci]
MSQNGRRLYTLEELSSTPTIRRYEMAADDEAAPDDEAALRVQCTSFIWELAVELAERHGYRCAPQTIAAAQLTVHQYFMSNALSIDKSSDMLAAAAIYVAANRSTINECNSPRFGGRNLLRDWVVSAAVNMTSRQSGVQLVSENYELFSKKMQIMEKEVNLSLCPETEIVCSLSLIENIVGALKLNGEL